MQRHDDALSLSMLTFGPVPSRRLGRSLGINNIPPKTCSFSCVYCQVGRTSLMRAERGTFYAPELVERAVRDRVEKARALGERVDYLTFVPDGEPTLDRHLGEEIASVKDLGLKVAVITNGSLLWRTDVRDELSQADWVSVKIDAIDADVWQRVDRPHGALDLDAIQEGILKFSRAFPGELTTETMLIANLNNMPGELSRVAEFIVDVNPKKSYLSIPTRPPAERMIRPAGEEALVYAHQLLREGCIDAELLVGYEGTEFACTGNVEEDLLSITSVHPMREDAMEAYLKRNRAHGGTLENLLREDKLVEVHYGGRTFYMRRVHR
jgi:wyosine [tRNA(Phe)-imidazoG37] synthetase (radical SAM superfamily)